MKCNRCQKRIATDALCWHCQQVRERGKRPWAFGEPIAASTAPDQPDMPDETVAKLQSEYNKRVQGRFRSGRNEDGTIRIVHALFAPQHSLAQVRTAIDRSAAS